MLSIEMTPTAALPFDQNVIAPFPVRRFTLDEYHRMASSGALTASARVELINGWIVPKVTLNPPHAIVVTKLTRWMHRCIPETYSVRTQQPITLRPNSEPEPDLVIASDHDDAFARSHPVAGQVLLVIEVSDSSLDIDRNEKLALYAANQIPEYWIVNLVDGNVEVCKEPMLNGYRQRQTFTDNDEIAVALNGVLFGQLAVDKILP